MSDAPLPTVLVVDDKPNMVTLLAKVLQRDARVLKATSGAAAIQLLAENEVDAVVCDLRMPDLDGLAVLDAVRRIRPSAQFVLMTAYGSVPSAIDAMKRGAFDYVTKPFEPDALRAIVLRALGRPSVPADPVAFEPLPGLIGSSLAMAEVARVVRRVAGSDVNVLLLGETGTGKELVARALHALGPRASAPFLRVDCGSIPTDALDGELFGSCTTGRDRPGLFEQAEAGTLFLDEIGEIRLVLQAKLTRVLEERRVRRLGDTRDRPVNARIVAATHRDVEALAREGSLREDLLYRLRVATVMLPPLRERGGDVAALAAHFLAELPPRVDGTRASVIAAPALLLLERYRWPGNVRELRAAIASAALVAEGDRIEVADLPAEIRAGGSVGPIDLASMSYQQALEAAREDATRRYLEAVLRRTKGKVAQAAEIAGIERESFYRLLRRYAVSPDDFRVE